VAYEVYDVEEAWDRAGEEGRRLGRTIAKKCEEVARALRDMLEQADVEVSESAFIDFYLACVDEAEDALREAKKPWERRLIRVLGGR